MPPATSTRVRPERQLAGPAGSGAVGPLPIEKRSSNRKCREEEPSCWPFGALDMLAPCEWLQTRPPFFSLFRSFRAGKARSGEPVERFQSLRSSAGTLPQTCTIRGSQSRLCEALRNRSSSATRRSTSVRVAS